MPPDMGCIVRISASDLMIVKNLFILPTISQSCQEDRGRSYLAVCQETADGWPVGLTIVPRQVDAERATLGVDGSHAM